MWKEYTRETPARPGLGIVAAVIALAATTGLAQYFTTQRSRIAVAVERTALPRWPIAFSVPKGFRPVGTTSDWNVLRSDDGTEGGVVYFKGNLAIPEMRLDIDYQVVPAGLSMDRVYRRLTQQPLDDYDEIAVGPLKGICTSRKTEAGAAMLRAVARTDEGLAIMISLIAEEDSPRTRRVLEGVCESVEFKDWVVRPR
ncbi:MAG: hypothetical protein HZA51_02510 [Planctomycetes bacterium]|nr:hypothetical protein [Planctomycetota bacterium]